MSETQPQTAQQVANDSLMSPQFLLAIGYTVVTAIAVIWVFWQGDDGNIKLVLGFVFGSFASPVSQFFFGSSKSSQAKDATIAAQAAQQGSQQ